MDENNNVQEFAVQNTISESSQIEETDIVETEDYSITPDSENKEQNNIARDTKDASTQNFVSESNVSEPFVSVQYNHKNQQLTKDEAIRLIQKGMHTESLRNKLEYVAKIQGVDVNTIVDKIVSVPEKLHREQLEKMYGKNAEEVEIGMQIYRQKQSEEYKKIVAERENSIEIKEIEKQKQSVNSRLADEYFTLKKAMPDAPEYSKLPDSVIIEAASGKRDLYSAYLCYLHKEKTKIDAAQNTQMAANAASLGAMSSDANDNVSLADKSFLDGMWQK